MRESGSFSAARSRLHADSLAAQRVDVTARRVYSAAEQWASHFGCAVLSSVTGDCCPVRLANVVRQLLTNCALGVECGFHGHSWQRGYASAYDSMLAFDHQSAHKAKQAIDVMPEAVAPSPSAASVGLAPPQFHYM